MDEKPKKKKSDKVAQIERLIELGRYDEADNMLKTMGFHPETPRLIHAIHGARPKPKQHKFMGILFAVAFMILILLLASTWFSIQEILTFGLVLVLATLRFWFRNFREDEWPTHEGNRHPND